MLKGLQRKIDQRRQRARPEVGRIVDQQIEPAEAFGCGDEPASVAGIGNISSHRNHAAAVVRDGRRGGCEIVRSAGGKNEIAVLRGEELSSGHRRYPRSVLRRIGFIVFAQRIGLTLDEIGAELTKLPTQRVPTGRDWSRLSRNWTARIDDRIAELERLKVGSLSVSGAAVSRWSAAGSPIPGTE